MPATPRRGTSIERDNPFRPGGEIEKEADDILRNSTISSERVSIIDPSSPQYKKPNGGLSNPTTPVEETSDHEQVVVSLNAAPASQCEDTGHTTPAGTTPNNQSPSSEQGNGHTATNNNDTVDGKGGDNNQTPIKKKKKKQKTCQII